jgi:YidC/Oxa1 family membrane protein insertase
MSLYDLPPVAAVLDVAYSAVTALTTLLTPFAGDIAAALAIVVLTLGVRAALIPVSRSQVRAEFTRKRIAPLLQALQKRYKKNPQLLAEKTTALYRDEKASPFAGMLPTLLQAPVLSIVYGLFILSTVGGQANALLGHDLFGASLGSTLFSAGWPAHLVLMAVIAVVSVLFRRANLRFTPPTSGEGAVQPGLQRVLSWMPLITVVFAAFVPLAATLYLAVTTTWTFVERGILRSRMDPNRPGRADVAAGVIAAR